MKPAKHQFLESQELEVQENPFSRVGSSFSSRFSRKTIGLISVDPSKRKQEERLGDRIG
jgi:hypothetical protein